MNENQNAAKGPKQKAKSSKRGVVLERQAKETTHETSPRKVTLLKASNWVRRASSESEQSLAHRYYQEPCPVHFDGTAGIGTKTLTEAFIKSTCANWTILYVTIQHQGRPEIGLAKRVLKEAAILRDIALTEGRYNRPSNAMYRTLDWFFEEQGGGANSGNRHFHGIVIIAPDHPRILDVENAIVDSVITGMARHLARPWSEEAVERHRQTLMMRQQAQSGKVVVVERCLNPNSCLAYSMKQFDIYKHYFSSVDHMPSAQLKRIGRLNEESAKNFNAALPAPPRYAQRLTAQEREAQSTPHPEGDLE